MMKVLFSIVLLLLLTFIVALMCGLFGLLQSQSHRINARQLETAYFQNSTGLVCAVDPGEWRFFGVDPGQGHCLTIREEGISHPATDGSSFYEICIQLPRGPLREGQEFSLRPLSMNREFTIHNATGSPTSELNEAEFCACVFANPILDCADDTSISSGSVKVLDVSGSSLKLHVKLHAELSAYLGDLVIDEAFNFRIARIKGVRLIL